MEKELKNVIHVAIAMGATLVFYLFAVGIVQAL